MKLKRHLSFTSLRKGLSACFNGIPEHRQAGKVDYSIHDTLMGGFACMHFQDPSLLQFQKRLDKKLHKSNLQTLFGVTNIPESTQLRSIIDGVDSHHLSTFFDDYFQRLQRGKHLQQFQLFPELYLVALDATDYFSSHTTNCKKCLRAKSTRKAKDGVDDLQEDNGDEAGVIRYSHKALQIAVMHPDMRQVIPLMPEEIYNTDGTTKQDCEMNAAKRLIPKLRKAHPRLGMILTGDDLFSRQPVIEDTLSAGMHYIYVAKPSSHTYLNEWLAAYPKLKEMEVVENIENKKAIKKSTQKNVRHVYEWMNKVPLHGGKESVNINYFRYRMFTMDKKGKERVGYQNSWVTDIEITEDNIKTLVRGGRCKWKIENECFNTLKNQGYCIDHSYGHGENLSFNFYLLTLIAFAFHQVFELTDKLYQECRRHFGSKRHLWENLRANLRTFIFSSWEYLLSFTLNPEDYTSGILLRPG